jgi:DNA-binding MarR family transcriptional regulator
MALVIADVCHRSTLDLACPISLTRNQFTLLKILATNGSFQISDLARLLDVSNAAASKNIDRLQQLGLVDRQAKPEDRRSFEIVLLEDGRKIVREYERIIEIKQQQVLGRFTAEEKEELLDMIRRIIRFTLAEEQDTEVICLQCGSRCGDSCLIDCSQDACFMPEKSHTPSGLPG